MKLAVFILINLFCGFLSAKQTENQRLFFIESSDLPIIETQALAGDATAASRLARFYTHSTSEPEIAKGYFWYYVSNLLSNYRSGIVISEFLIREGQKPPVDIASILLKFEKYVFEKSANIPFSDLIKYHYYLKTSNKEKSDYYLGRLENKVDERLLVPYDITKRRREAGCLDRGFLLDPDEVRVYQQLALEGDGSKAFKLYLHYKFSHDMDSQVSKPLSQIFLYMALVLQNENAKQHLPYLTLSGQNSLQFGKLRVRTPPLEDIFYTYMDFISDMYNNHTISEKDKVSLLKNRVAPELLKKYKCNNGRLHPVDKQ